MSDDETVVHAALARERAAQRKLQSGLAALEHYTPKLFTPKHARVGIDTALVEIAAIAELLVKKGLISDLEVVTAQADAMEREVKRLEAELTGLTGANVTLGEAGSLGE